jgi:hypothetical protein
MNDVVPRCTSCTVAATHRPVHTFSVIVLLTPWKRLTWRFQFQSSGIFIVFFLSTSTNGRSTWNDSFLFKLEQFGDNLFSTRLLHCYEVSLPTRHGREFPGLLDFTRQ